MISRKIVAIGGGENGRLKPDGTRKPYETGVIDQEIVRLTGKDQPNFLFLAHAQADSLERQQSYFEAMWDIYGWRYGCKCKDLKSDKLTDIEYVKELVDWADIIYEWWWNTITMLELWKQTGFDQILRTAWENGKVMCGLSAWWNCWFNKCSSNAWANQSLVWVDCLWFVNWLFVPHADESGRQESVKELLVKEQNEIWLLLSNCAALVVVDDKYKLITSPEAVNHWLERAFWKKTYWEDGNYFEVDIKELSELRGLDELYSRL